MNSPSASIFAAPLMVSSAGWPISISVPRHRLRVLAMMRAVPIQEAM